jgi:hypothetical protein
MIFRYHSISAKTQFLHFIGDLSPLLLKRLLMKIQVFLHIGGKEYAQKNAGPHALQIQESTHCGYTRSIC